MPDQLRRSPPPLHLLPSSSPSTSGRFTAPPPSPSFPHQTQPSSSSPNPRSSHQTAAPSSSFSFSSVQSPSPRAPANHLPPPIQAALLLRPSSLHCTTSHAIPPPSSPATSRPADHHHLVPRAPPLLPSPPAPPASKLSISASSFEPRPPLSVLFFRSRKPPLLLLDATTVHPTSNRDHCSRTLSSLPPQAGATFLRLLSLTADLHQPLHRQPPPTIFSGDVSGPRPAPPGHCQAPLSPVPRTLPRLRFSTLKLHPHPPSSSHPGLSNIYPGL